MNNYCGSKVTMGKDTWVCDKAPHNDLVRHSASVALQLQPVLDLRRTPKWITGNITWKD